jgi:chromate transporter
MAASSRGLEHIAKTFFKIGSTAFGGWATTAVLIEKEFGEHHTKPNVPAAVAYAQLLPGATQVSLVANVGYQLRGFRGASIATASYLLPAMSLITLFAAVYFQYLYDVPNLTEHLDGLVAALAGIILANAYKIGEKHATHWFLWFCGILAWVGRLWLHINPVLILVFFGACGLLYYAGYRKRHPA